MGLDPKSDAQKSLSFYRDPTKTSFNSAGDLANAVCGELKKRNGESYSDATIGDVNRLLDEMAMMNRGDLLLNRNVNNAMAGKSSSSSSSTTRRRSNPYVVQKKRKSRKQRRTEWCQSLTDKYRLSPVEQKWIVRMLMGKMDIHLNHESILRYLHPDMINMYSAVQNLEVVCAQLADREYMRRRKLKKKALMQIETSMLMSNSLSYKNMFHHMDKVTIGVALSPMLAARTSYESLLSDIQRRLHNNPVLLKTSLGCTSAEYKEKIQDLPLAMKHPPFIGEVKMDGERMIFHVKRGVVTVHSRRNTWYSNR